MNLINKIKVKGIEYELGDFNKAKLVFKIPYNEENGFFELHFKEENYFDPHNKFYYIRYYVSYDDVYFNSEILSSSIFRGKYFTIYEDVTPADLDLVVGDFSQGSIVIFPENFEANLGDYIEIYELPITLGVQ